MSEEIQNAEEGQSDLMDNDELKEAVEAQMRKIHNQGMVIGFQTACHTMLDKIYAFDRIEGKKTANDYKRLVKDIREFCNVGVSRKLSTIEND